MSRGQRGDQPLRRLIEKRPKMRQAHRHGSALLLMAILAFGGSIVTATSSPTLRAQVEKQPQDQSRESVFNGKILSQNGQRFILRDNVNDVWYQLDDQQQAGKFLGKDVLVTGVLDESTATIHVRSMIEAKV